ncbi:glycylpeptide N-tetradecanoyltransferase 1 isoform X3 [Mauremys reevesii]|uniref:glycylpeptide N-tetradecanoyltransferase 1 isoform X3 n=1 Tax=Mauremys reevesii TaxID=260615 RepID=UPI00193F33D4|nr:glycylpeptide N-tetradecanoyltransferase 1 isoform X3 [Mauremys reevesii]
MADEGETAVKRPPSRPQRSSGEENDHEHCSDCENEDEHSYNRGGLSPVDDSGAKKKKKKQKRKKEKGGDQVDAAQDQPVKVKLPAERIQEIQKAIELFSVGQGPAKTMEEASKRSYQFWDTQPVPKLGEVVNTHGPVEPDKDNIRQEPYTLPPSFTWDALDLGDRGVLKELYTLLNENYVEDDDNMFRFDYSPEFLLWALRPPGWLPQWHCGVRVISSKKLVGFISAIPATIHIYDSEKKMVEINFLCVHKKLRSKRVAPVLIREITRRVHLEGIFQAVYTAGVVLPKPVGTCRYWHRSLNPRKLIEVKFSHLSRNMTMQRTMKLYRLPEVCAWGCSSCCLSRLPAERKGLAPELAVEGDSEDVHPAGNGAQRHCCRAQASDRVPEAVPPDPSHESRGGGALVLPSGEHHRHLRGGEPHRRGDRLPELLHAAFHHHEPPHSQEPESRVLLLQRAHQDSPPRPHERRPHPRQVEGV